MADVLFLANTDPNSQETGADVRVNNIREHLCKVFDVTTITFVDNPEGYLGSDVRAIDRPSLAVFRLINLKYLSKEITVIKAKEFDVIYISSINVSIYGFIAILITDSFTVIDNHNVTYKMKWEQGFYFQSVLFYILEKTVCFTADLVVTVSEVDQQHLSKWIKNDSLVVTNGFTSEKYTIDGSAARFDNPVVIFFGNMGYKPNIDAVRNIAERIAPQLERSNPNIEIHLLGPYSEHIRNLVADNKNVMVKGFVEDLPRYIRGADLVIVPLADGSGTRLKIIESLACGTEVLSTPKGAEGWPTKWDNLHISPLCDFYNKIPEIIHGSEFDRTEYDKIESHSWKSQASKLCSKICDSINNRW